jgi:hypothetical protein
MRALEKPPILLVDDHAAVRHGLALVLTEEGVGHCREASGGTTPSKLPGASRPIWRWWTSRLGLTMPCNW